MITSLLAWAYNGALRGLPGLESAQELANDYRRRHASEEEAIDSLILWQVSKTVTTGFVTGIGGAITLPVAIPASLASSLYVQIRMVAAIAYIRGLDVHADATQSFAYACLCGDAARDILKSAGVTVSTKLATRSVQRLSGEVVLRINQAVGFRLLTKFGTKGVVNLASLVPVAGALVGAIVDGSSTYAVGRTAARLLSGPASEATGSI